MKDSFLGGIVSVIVNTTPVPFAPRSERVGVLAPRKLTAEREMSAMGTVGTLFGIVSHTSNSTAQVDWKLYRKLKPGQTGEREEVLYHPALVVWEKPNQFYTRQEFVETFQQHVDLTGEGWWIIEYAGSRPVAMWPVRPDRMAPVKHSTDFLSGYIYTSPEGTQIPLGLNEVIQLRMPNPLDPYRGMGPVQAIMPNLEADRFAAEWNRNYFLNSAEPGGIIEAPNGLSDTEFNRLSDQWSENHRGVSNAHRVAILEKATYKYRTYSMKDMDFTGWSTLTRDKILEAFSFPKFMLGVVDDVNRANAEASKAMYAENLIVPRLERIKGALNNDFLPMFGTLGAGLEFDYVSPVPEYAEAKNANMAAATSAYKTLIDSGADPVLAAAYCGLPDMGVKAPIGGGNDGS